MWKHYFLCNRARVLRMVRPKPNRSEDNYIKSEMHLTWTDVNRERALTLAAASPINEQLWSKRAAISIIFLLSWLWHTSDKLIQSLRYICLLYILTYQLEKKGFLTAFGADLCHGSWLLGIERTSDELCFFWAQSIDWLPRHLLWGVVLLFFPLGDHTQCIHRVIVMSFNEHMELTIQEFWAKT